MLWRYRDFGCDGPVAAHLVDSLERAFNSAPSEEQQIKIAHVLSFFLRIKETDIKDHELNKPDQYDSTWGPLRREMVEMGLPLPSDGDDDEKCYVDNRVFKAIQFNTLSATSAKDMQYVRENLREFLEAIRILQNYCYYSKRVCLAKILGKLFTRCRWIMLNSSPLSNFQSALYESDPVPTNVTDESDEDN
jgi:hypothetical protein